MNDQQRSEETPERRCVEGLLGLLRPGTGQQIHDGIESALEEIDSSEERRRNRMRIWSRIGSGAGLAASITILILVFLFLQPEASTAVADIDRTLESMREAPPRWYQIEFGRVIEEETTRVMKGSACVHADGRFVAFIRQGNLEGREIIIGNDGIRDWSIPSRDKSIPNALVRRIFEQLSPTVAAGSVDPARILRLVRSGWTLKRMATDGDGRSLTRVEASSPAGPRGERGRIDHITLVIDPVRHTLERLEATRRRNGTEDGSAYLLFERMDPDRIIAGFERSDHLRTDRTRDPDPSP